MPGSWSPQDHPGLTDNSCVVTSPKTNAYNCIAWAAGDDTRWWWPSALRGIAYWPSGVPREVNIDAFIAAFATRNYVPCADGALVDGVEKVALYAKNENGFLVPTHAALQLRTGEWTSKMGSLEDISHHTFDAVDGPTYGEAVRFLSRPRK